MEESSLASDSKTRRSEKTRWHSCSQTCRKMKKEKRKERTATTLLLLQHSLSSAGAPCPQEARGAARVPEDRAVGAQQALEEVGDVL